MGIWGPLPDGGLLAQTENLQVLYSPSLDAYFLADQDVDYSQLPLAQATPAIGQGPLRSGGFSPMDSTADSGSGSPSFDTNGLWLEITNVANDCSYVNLHNATNQVYAIWSATNLSSGWQVEMEVWPTNATTIPMITPFTVQNAGRQTLCLFAEDWTGVTENGNTTPDWWFWEYFGTTALSDTNLDDQGNTLLSDYTNGIDPNVIAFTMSTANVYVNQASVPVQVEVSAGVPSFYAVLVNDTNTALAKWQPYTGANLTVTLGSTQGTYLVWVGLRGRPANATQTWSTQDLRFKLDLKPPLLVINNPVSSTLAQPFLELQGYSTEPLSSISYDLNNAAGLLPNQPVLVLDQFYDTNALDFTTNTFQAFDVPLTNGPNVITLHATDLAGNSTNIVLSYTLDYSGGTNPPAVQLYWPQNGAQISGTSITWRGHVNDFTCTLQAQVVDASGDTNLVAGLVERDGDFWVENVPLTQGTNELSLIAVDAAGNTSATNITIVGSSVNLTIDPVVGDLWQPTNNVTGTMDTPGYTIWVNGIQATQNGDGTWSAAGVPMTRGGTARPPGAGHS